MRKTYQYDSLCPGRKGDGFTLLDQERNVSRRNKCGIVGQEVRLHSKPSWLENAGYNVWKGVMKIEEYRTALRMKGIRKTGRYPLSRGKLNCQRGCSVMSGM